MKTTGVTRAAFLDELMEIEKGASFVQNLGGHAATAGRWAGRTLMNSGDNAGRTFGAMLSPRRAMGEGMDQTVSAFQNAGALSKGYQVYSLARDFKDVYQPSDPAGLGRSRVRRTLNALGGQAGGLIGLPFGLPGNVIGVGVGNRVGDAAGRVIDKIRRYRPQPQVPQGY